MDNFTSTFTSQKQSCRLISAIFIVLFLSLGSHVHAQGISSGVTFNWADTQTNLSDPATIESIVIDGKEYNTFVVPSTYEMTRLGPGGADRNNIWLNGTEIATSSDEVDWNTKAIAAYQDYNLNHYFQSSANGDNFCEDFSAVATTDSQIQTISYNPGIPSNPDGILAVTERGGNNCQYIELVGIPAGGTTEEILGSTFVRNQGDLRGVGPQEPPRPNSDYWSSGRNNENDQVIGVALFELSDIAPVGSVITAVRYFAATTDNGDGKFFLMQTYAVDDYFDAEFEEVFTGDVSANDNIPDGSVYMYYSSVPPFNGNLVVNPDGSFTYTPNPGFVGTDVFEVEVCLPAPNNTVCNVSTVTMAVNPEPSSLSIDNASAEEGDRLTFTITNSIAIDEDIIIDLSYSNTTTTDSDYTGPTSVTLPAFTSSVSFDVEALDDDWLESLQETFRVNIATNSSVPVDDNEGIGTITDTDEATISTGNYDVLEDVGTIQLRIFLATTGNNVGVEQAFTVDVTVNSSGLPFPATDGSDYNATSATISFPASSMAGTEFTIPLTILDDAVVEPSERVIQRLSNVSFNRIGLAGPGGIVRIHDNDIATVSLQDITVNESVGTTDYIFTLNGQVQDSFSIDYQTNDNSAINPEDYTNSNGTINFTGNNGETRERTLMIVDDALIENTENFTVGASYAATAPTFTNALAQNIVFSNNPGTVTISDNDGGTGTGIDFDSTDVVVDENAGTATFTVRLTGNVPGGFTLDYATANGSAISPDDYSAVSGQLTFLGNDDESFDIVVPVIDDLLIEATEGYTVNLSNLSTTLIGINTPQANGGINDNDARPGIEGLSFVQTDVTITEGNPGDIVEATFDVRLTGNYQDAFEVTYETAFGTATDTDLEAQIGVLPFDGTDGQVQTITIIILNDLIIEPSEFYSVLLTGTTNTAVTVNTPEANGTILDDDARMITSSDYEAEYMILCGEEIPEIPELTFSGGCGEYQVDFIEVEEASDTSDDYMIVRTWNVTDACGNTASFEQVLMVMQLEIALITIDICVADEAIDLITYLPENFNTNGTFTLTQGVGQLNGNIFDPSNLELGEYTASYSSTVGFCTYLAEYTINVNADCVECSEEDIIVSTAVTPNGDSFNDVFEISGAENCDFTYDLMIFNRWGNKVFEDQDYQNDWGGIAPNSSFGTNVHLPSGTYYYIISVRNRLDLKPINGYIYIGTK